MRKPEINLYEVVQNRYPNSRVTAGYATLVEAGVEACWQDVRGQETKILAEIRRMMKNLGKAMRTPGDEWPSDYEAWRQRKRELGLIYKMIRQGGVSNAT